MKFNLEIPAELITEDSHEIKYDFLTGKTIVGCCGFARSGKDTLGNLMVNHLNFHMVFRHQ